VSELNIFLLLVYHRLSRYSHGSFHTNELQENCWIMKPKLTGCSSRVRRVINHAKTKEKAVKTILIDRNVV
jgi:hypothetical protein